MSGQGLTGLSSRSRRLVAAGVLVWCLISVFPLY